METTVVQENRAKIKLQQGSNVFAIILAEIHQPAIMQVLANCGFDLVVIDNEHGPFTIDMIAELSRAAIAAGITPAVRIPEISYAHVVQPLDVGCQGLMVPRVSSAEDVRLLMEMINYPPKGIRGNAQGRGYTQFRSGVLTETLGRAVSETLLIVQIETKGAVEDKEAIISHPGVDVAWIGPTDLSIALGIPGKVEDPLMTETITSVFSVCRSHDVYPAMHTTDVNVAKEWLSKGAKIINFGSELGLIMQKGKEILNNVKETT